MDDRLRSKQTLNTSINTYMNVVKLKIKVSFKSIGFHPLPNSQQTQKLSLQILFCGAT